MVKVSRNGFIVGLLLLAGALLFLVWQESQADSPPSTAAGLSEIK